jgi:hypothetical protein
MLWIIMARSLYYENPTIYMFIMWFSLFAIWSTSSLEVSGSNNWLRPFLMIYDLF